MLGMLGIDEERYLMRTEGPLDLEPVDNLRARPTLGRPQDDDRPARSKGFLGGPRRGLELPNVLNGPVQDGGHEFMHRRWIVALDEVGRPTAAAQELLQLLVLDAGQHGRVADLVAVQMQDRQNGTVSYWIEQLVGLPCGRQGASFRLTVADDAGDNQFRIVERGAKGMAQGVAQFAAFVDRPRRGRCNVAGNAARERKLLEQTFESGFIQGDVRINLAPGAFEIHIAHDRRAAMTGTGNVDHV